MGLIDQVEHDLWQLHDLPIWTREDVRQILAPLAAELEAAREAVECVAILKHLCYPGKLLAVVLSQGNSGSWRVDVLHGTGATHHGTLLSALRAADAAKRAAETKQEKPNV